MPGKPQVVLDLTYNEVARRLLLHQEVETISQEMCLRLPTLQQMLRRPEFQRVLERVKEKSYETLDKTIEDDKKSIRQRIDDEASASLDRLVHLRDNAVAEGVKLNAAQDLLDRGGYARQAEKGPQVAIQINALDAQVLSAALKKDEEGRIRLEAIPGKLLDTPESLVHPMKEHGKRDRGTTRQAKTKS